MADDPWSQFMTEGERPTGADPWAQFMQPGATAVSEPQATEPQGPPDERPFLERAGSKLASFFHRVTENPPPSVQFLREIGPAAQELTWGADPEAARAAVGPMLQAAGFGSAAPGLLASEGIFGAPLRQRPAIPGAAAPAISAATPAAAATAAAGRLGVDYPYFLSTEGETIPRLAQAAKEAPWSGEPIVAASQKLLADLGQAKSGLVTGTGTTEGAGSAAKRALEDWITSGSQKPVAQAYKDIEAALPGPRLAAELQAKGEESINTSWLTNTANEVKNILDERVNARIPGSSKAADQVLQAIQSPMDYEGIKRLRSFIGEQTPEQLVAGGINPTENKRLYSALTKDLGDVILQTGGDQAFAKWQEANTLARLTSMQRNMLTKVVGSKGEASAEQVFSRLASYAGSKSSADIGRLRLAKSAMGLEAWNEISGSMINRMGAGTEGKFSADRFVTAFNGMSPAARNTMFDANQLATLSDLFTVSKQIQDRITHLSNPSGTGRTLISVGTALHLLHSPVTAMAQIVGARTLAHALSRPAIVKAAADAGRASLAGNAAAYQLALRRLQGTAVRAGLVSAAEMSRQIPPPGSQPLQ